MTRHAPGRSLRTTLHAARRPLTASGTISTRTSPHGAGTGPAAHPLLVPIAHPSITDQARRFLELHATDEHLAGRVECGVAAVLDRVVVASAVVDDEAVLHPIMGIDDRDLLVALIDRTMRHAARSGTVRVRVRAGMLRPTARRRLRQHGIHHVIATDGMVDLFAAPPLSHSA